MIAKANPPAKPVGLLRSFKVKDTVYNFIANEKPSLLSFRLPNMNRLQQRRFPAA